MTDILYRVCAWCVAEGRTPKPPDPLNTTHGCCASHQAQIGVMTPLETAIARLRSNEYLGHDARLAIARDIQTVVARLDRLTIHESPALSPDLPASMPVDDMRVAAPGDTPTERTIA